MVATELPFVGIHSPAGDAIKAGVLSIPRRPGPAPARTDAELLTIAPVRGLLGRRSGTGFLEEIRRDWAGLFPHPPGPAGGEPPCPLAAGCPRAVPRGLRGLRTR